jgi:hypothetical protein
VKRIVVGFAAVAIGVLAVLALFELTSNQPDELVPGSTSELVLSIETKPPLTKRQGATSLISVCMLRAHEHQVVGQRAAPNDNFVYVIEPAFGEHSRKRVVGCLEDATIERVLGDVTEVRTRLPS